MNCNYCLDTGAVDKDGNPKGDHKGVLHSCPLCKKDGTPKVDAKAVEAIVKSEAEQIGNRYKKAWTLEFPPTLFGNETEQAVKELVTIIKENYGAFDSETGKRISVKPAAFLGQLDDQWYRIGLHYTIPYEGVKMILENIRLEDGKYRVGVVTAPDDKSNKA